MQCLRPPIAVSIPRQAACTAHSLIYPSVSSSPLHPIHSSFNLSSQLLGLGRRPSLISEHTGHQQGKHGHPYGHQWKSFFSLVRYYRQLDVEFSTQYRGPIYYKALGPSKILIMLRELLNQYCSTLENIVQLTNSLMISDWLVREYKLHVQYPDTLCIPPFPSPTFALLNILPHWYVIWNPFFSPQ